MKRFTLALTFLALGCFAAAQTAYAQSSGSQNFRTRAVAQDRDLEIPDSAFDQVPLAGPGQDGGNLERDRFPQDRFDDGRFLQDRFQQERFPQDRFNDGRFNDGRFADPDLNDRRFDPGLERDRFERDSYTRNRWQKPTCHQHCGDCYRWVTKYRFEEVAYRCKVLRYRSCGTPYYDWVVKYKTVKVPYRVRILSCGH